MGVLVYLLLCCEYNFSLTSLLSKFTICGVRYQLVRISKNLIKIFDFCSLIIVLNNEITKERQLNRVGIYPLVNTSKFITKAKAFT